ncbi:MAG: UPF0755 protein [Bacteroidia bacterium]|jgi:UPF0755 protein
MKKAIRNFFILMLIIVPVAMGLVYFLALQNNLKSLAKNELNVFLTSDASYEDLYLQLEAKLNKPEQFDLLAKQMNLPNHIHPGMYTLKKSMSNVQIVRLFRSGKHTPIKLMLKPGIKRNEIFGVLGKLLQPDSISFVHFIDTATWLKEHNLNQETWSTIFHGNTFFFKWSTGPEQVFNRFLKESTKFWNAQRMASASNLDLSKKEVYILASIVDAEAIFNAEMPTIAGLYLNRLEKKMFLQADPTILFFVNEDGRKRVLYDDLKKESPYNTYLNVGLPPGPVLLPSDKAIDAVLNASSHDYIFFCAKADLSGYHEFTASYNQHLRNRDRYKKALDARGIKR